MTIYLGCEFATYLEFENVLASRKNYYREKWRIGSGDIRVKCTNKDIPETHSHFSEPLEVLKVEFEIFYDDHSRTGVGKPGKM